MRLNESVDCGKSVDSERSKDWRHYLEDSWLHYLGVRVVKGEMKRNQQRRQKELLEVGGKPGKYSILQFIEENVFGRKVWLTGKCCW